MAKKRIALIFFITFIAIKSLALDDDIEGDQPICLAVREILEPYLKETLQTYSPDPAGAWSRGYLQIAELFEDDDTEVLQETFCEAARNVLTAPARAICWVYDPRNLSFGALITRSYIMIGSHYLAFYMFPSTMATVCARASILALLFSTYSGRLFRE